MLFLVEISRRYFAHVFKYKLLLSAARLINYVCSQILLQNRAYWLLLTQASYKSSIWRFILI